MPNRAKADHNNHKTGLKVQPVNAIIYSRHFFLHKQFWIPVSATDGHQLPPTPSICELSPTKARKASVSKLGPTLLKGSVNDVTGEAGTICYERRKLDTGCLNLLDKKTARVPSR